MIKKLSIAAAVLAVVVLAGVLYFKRSMGPSDAATLVPSDTVVFLNILDVPRTALRWSGSALAKIGKEPEMKAFLEKPFARLKDSPGSIEASGILSSLKPGNLFLAVTDVSAAHIDVLVGFQYWGGRAEFEKAVARMRKELPADPTPPTTEVYEGQEIVASKHGANTFYSASLGQWGFVATRAEAIKFALDSASGKSRDDTLAANPRLQSVSSHLLNDPDLRIFIQPEKAVEALLTLGQDFGAQSIPEQVGYLKSAEAVGATWKIDGLVQRDAIFVLRKNSAPIPTLGRQVIQLTSNTTVAVIDALVPTESLTRLIASVLPTLATNPDVAAIMDLGTQAYGPEAGLVANWPGGQMAPSVLLAIKVRDKEKAARFVSSTLAVLPNHVATQQNGLSMYSVPAFGNPFAAPTFAQTDEFLLFGLDATSVSTAAGRTAGSPTLETAAVFPSLAASFNAANEAFVFVDSATIFERAYTALRPVIIFGATVMPDIGAYIDTAKLPQTETITKHLAPMTLAQQASGEGTLIESSGPITVIQAIVAGTLAGGAASSGLVPR